MSEIIIPSIDEQNKTVTPDGVVISNCTILENGNISGYTPEGKKALYSNKKNQWFFGRDIGRNNLVDLSLRTDEERKRIGSLGAKKRDENREQKKNIEELAKIILERSMSDDMIQNILGDKAELIPDNSIASVMVGAMVKQALEGSFKAFEAVRDTAGYKPATKTEVDLSAEIMTESDRALIDKVSKVG